MTTIKAPASNAASSRWRAAFVALAVVSAIGFWQLAPSSSVAASPAHDDIARAELAPASFADVIGPVKPAVVNISTSARLARPRRGATPGSPFPPGSPFEEFFRRFMQPQSDQERQGPLVRGAGSGFLIDPDGYVVTNHHVVEQAESITVTLDDGCKYDAELLGSDTKTDLALLKVEAEEALPYASFGNSDETRVGDWVIAIGNPFGLGGTATTGIVSARGRDIQAGPFDDFLQIDAPINRGNSGGPLFDMNGRVVGINTAIYSPNGGSVGIGFAIPAAQAEPVIEALRTEGHVERGWLGVEIQPVDEDIAESLGLETAEGALVARVMKDSPAESAGVTPGDIILGVNGERAETLKDVTRAVAAARPGDEVTVDVWRDGKRESLAVTIGESEEASGRPSRLEESDAPSGKLGFTLSELSPESRRRFQVRDDVEGALVVSVRPDGPAARKGLRPGDVITMVGRQPVRSVEETATAIKELESRGTLLLQVARGERRSFVAVPLD